MTPDEKESLEKFNLICEEAEETAQQLFDLMKAEKELNEVHYNKEFKELSAKLNKLHREQSKMFKDAIEAKRRSNQEKS